MVVLFRPCPQAKIKIVPFGQIIPFLPQKLLQSTQPLPQATKIEIILYRQIIPFPPFRRRRHNENTSRCTILFTLHRETMILLECPGMIGPLDTATLARRQTIPFFGWERYDSGISEQIFLPVDKPRGASPHRNYEDGTSMNRII